MQMMLFMNWMEKNFAVRGDVSYFMAVKAWGSAINVNFDFNCVISTGQTILCLVLIFVLIVITVQKKKYLKTGILLCSCLLRVTIEHARARSRGRGRGRYSDRFSSRRPRSDRRYVQL